MLRENLTPFLRYVQRSQLRGMGGIIRDSQYILDFETQYSLILIYLILTLSFNPAYITLKVCCYPGIGNLTYFENTTGNLLRARSGDNNFVVRPCKTD